MIAIALLAMLVPLGIHLLSKRHAPVIDWAAMQFLELAQTARRQIHLDDALLLALRMLLVLIAGLAFAGLSVPGSWLPALGRSEATDTVIVVDASGSMSLTADGVATRDRVTEAVEVILGQTRSGDRFAVIAAGSAPTAILPLLTDDPAEVRAALQKLPPFAGRASIPESIRLARSLLKSSLRPTRIAILGDGRRHGYADKPSLERLDLLKDDSPIPITVVDLRPDWPPTLFNASAEAIVPSRLIAVAGREVKLKTGLRWTGPVPPAGLPKVTLEVDGRVAGDIPVPPAPPAAAGETGGRIPLTVTHRFAVAGSHRVRVKIADDALPADNVQDLALEVVAGIPVLLIDGQPPAAKPRRSDYLRTALAPEGDPTPSFFVRTVSAESFTPSMLTAKVSNDPESLPRLAILADVPRLAEAQIAAVEAFVEAGGGLLVAAGGSVESKWYENRGWKGGWGWLPAKLAEIVGDETDILKAPRIVADSLLHPSVEALREADAGLGKAWFPRLHRLEPGRDSSVVAALDTRLPLLVEKAFGRGRTMISAVPLDASWGTNLPRLGDYVRLTHEVAGWLAGAGRADVGTSPGQPLVYLPKPGEAAIAVVVDLPDGSQRRIEPSRDEPATLRETSLPGSYRFRAGDGPVRWQVIRGDADEADLSALSAEDRSAMAERLPGLTWREGVNGWQRAEADGESRVSLTLWLLLLAVALMFAEGGRRWTGSGTPA